MYDSLKPELITATTRQRAQMNADPTYVVERGMFRENQYPYLEVRRPFILGTQEQKWKATLAHRFLEVLHQRTGKLTRLYTQNIDGLDFQCESIPASKIVPVHGTIGKAGCEACGADTDFGAFCALVRANIKDLYRMDPAAPAESSPVTCEACGKASVKPKTVLFGSNLPAEFFERKREDLGGADLLIVAGTSLVVGPANTVASDVPAATVRLVVNREPVGEHLGLAYGGDPATARDLFAPGDCDATFLRLADLLGWRADMEAFKEVLPEAGQVLLGSAPPAAEL